MSKLLTKIISDSFTKQEVQVKLMELKIVAENHFFGKKDWTDFEKELLEGVSRDNIEEVFQEANRELEKIDTLVLSIALELPEEVVSQIGRKARSLFGEDLLLEFKVNPDLIGGTALVWQGKYKDYSLKSKFEQKKQEIKEIYQKFNDKY